MSACTTAEAGDLANPQLQSRLGPSGSSLSTRRRGIRLAKSSDQQWPHLRAIAAAPGDTGRRVALLENLRLKRRQDQSSAIGGLAAM